MIKKVLKKLNIEILIKKTFDRLKINNKYKYR